MNALGVLLILGSTIAVNGLESRIVGGQIATVGRYPYQASIWDHNTFRCGGSIITERFILTAAHCIYQKLPHTITVVVGTNYLQRNGDTYNVDKLIWHNDYSAIEILNDIGLIRVDKKIALNKTIQPIHLAPVFDIPSGEIAVVTGWGKLYPESSVPNALREMYTIVVSQESCQEAFAQVNDNNICTLTVVNEGVCFGDSGSPLVVDGVQVGIVSYGYGCAIGTPDVYTRVHPYVDWIHSHTNVAGPANAQCNAILILATTTLLSYLCSLL